MHPAQRLIGSKFEGHVWHIFHESGQVPCEQPTHTCKLYIQQVEISAGEKPCLALSPHTRVLKQAAEVTDGVHALHDTNPDHAQ